MKDLIQSLIYIQQHLIVPKDQFNSFGKYNYRSLESILAAINNRTGRTHLPEDHTLLLQRQG